MNVLMNNLVSGFKNWRKGFFFQQSKVEDLIFLKDLKLFCGSVLFLISAVSVNAQTTIYANSISGNDVNDGLSPANPKKNLYSCL